MFNKYWHTIKYLKAKQIWFRLYYAVRKKLTGNKTYTSLQKLPSSVQQQNLRFSNLIPANTSYIKGNQFTFLNLLHTFNTPIDWNFAQYGKLWTYNLNYFEFLLQPQMTREEGIELMMDFAENYSSLKDAHEPYPTSLRIMNWVKFVAVHEIESKTVNGVIYTDLLRLQKNIEYHLMGNHLLENGFALLFGALYFNDQKTLRQGESIVEKELKEQILSDGAHFELSPMYHSIILSRVLDLINFILENQVGKVSLLSVNLQKQLKVTAEKMLGWLSAITFRNKDIPHVNDSTAGIAPSPERLIQYANSLNIQPETTTLGESGYRKFYNSNYELLVDVGNIGPDYIPGHAHSDTFNFVLCHNGNPLIVDTGISTYEKNQQRYSERATSAHNTVMVNEQDQSEVWGGFRVARRAKSTILEEGEGQIIASHTGYHAMNITHQRTFQIRENKCVVKDELTQSANAKAFLHFHPEVSVTIGDTNIKGNFGEITICGATTIKKQEYQYALGFNKTVKAEKVVITFEKNLETTFEWI